MSLGFDAISALPFATSGPDSDVTFAVTGNQVTISIGNPGIVADSITEIPDPNRLTLGFGSLSIRGDANFGVTGSQVAIAIGTVTVSADANITPSGNQVVISSGTVTVTGQANVSPTGSTFTLATGTAQAITWSEIIPGANMVWTPIDPGV